MSSSRSDPDLARRSILWVEDGDDDVLLFRLAADSTALSDHLDVEQSFAAGLERAMAAVDDGRPYRVVMTDLRLGAHDGCDLVAAVRLAADRIDTEFVVLTGSVDARDIDRIEASGARHVAKPATFPEWERLAHDIAALVDLDA